MCTGSGRHFRLLGCCSSSPRHQDRHHEAARRQSEAERRARRTLRQRPRRATPAAVKPHGAVDPRSSRQPPCLGASTPLRQPTPATGALARHPARRLDLPSADDGDAAHPLLPVPAPPRGLPLSAPCNLQLQVLVAQGASRQSASASLSISPLQLTNSN